MTSTLPNLHTERDLHTPAKAQPPAAERTFEEVHAAYGQRIFRFLLSSVRDRDLAATLTQETFLRAWTASGTDAQFRGKAAHLTWLMRIALNLLRDHTRTDRFRFWKRASRSAISAAELAAFLPDGNSSAETNLIAREQLALIWESMPRLSERQRTVFLLRFVEELELAEIAAVTNLPLPTVKTHLYRALTAIRREHLPPAVAPQEKTR